VSRRRLTHPFWRTMPSWRRDTVASCCSPAVLPLPECAAGFSLRPRILLDSAARPARMWWSRRPPLSARVRRRPWQRRDARPHREAAPPYHPLAVCGGAFSLTRAAGRHMMGAAVRRAPVARRGQTPAPLPRRKVAQTTCRAHLLVGFHLTAARPRIGYATLSGIGADPP
jgi:hypothetical protein